MSWALDRGIRTGFQTGLRLLYPPRCIGCGDMVENEFGLCGSCWRDTSFITGAVCDACGVPLPGPPDGHRLECDTCMQSPRLWTRGRAAMLYAGVGRKLVLGLKHGDRQDIVRPAGVWLSRAAKPLLCAGLLIAPVPLHWTRLIKRRYNQSALVSNAMARNLGLDHCPDLLLRRRRTASLDGKDRQARHDELDGAIRVHPNRRHRLAGRVVLLVDDVMTSGATLEACAEACLGAGAADVRVVVLARVANNP